MKKVLAGSIIGLFVPAVAFAAMPTCTLTATPSVINRGQTSTITWTTTNATKVEFTGVRGKVATSSGSAVVKPKGDNWFHLNVWGKNPWTVFTQCSVLVKVNQGPF